MDRDTHISDIVSGARETGAAVEAFVSESAPALVALARATVASLAKGGKLIAFGNGGSAADAQHLVAEFVGRYRMERSPMAAIALTVNTSVLTCVGNDYGFDEVFSRQVRALARPGDVALGISTSGASPNVVAALKAARTLGCRTVGLTGEKGRSLAALCDDLFAAPTDYTPRVQECHIAWIHAFCDVAEKLWAAEEGGLGA